MVPASPPPRACILKIAPREGLQVSIGAPGVLAQPPVQNGVFWGFYAAWGMQGLNNKISIIFLA